MDDKEKSSCNIHLLPTKQTEGQCMALLHCCPSSTKSLLQHCADIREKDCSCSADGEVLHVCS